MSPLTLRRWHGYVGLFAAPSVLFFALTGAAQLFNWHEAHGSYQPPVLLERLSSLHKDQVLKRHDDGEKSEHAGSPEGSEADGSAPHEEESMRLPTLILKVFFFLVAIGVTFSTCFGVWMGLTQTPRKGLSIGLLVIGALLPIILIAL
jgi:hypothetical protein